MTRKKPLDTATKVFMIADLVIMIWIAWMLLR